MDFTYNLEEFGNQLRMIREYNDIEIIDVCKSKNIKEQTLIDLECGVKKPSLELLDKLSDFYGYNILELYNDSRKHLYLSDFYNVLDMLLNSSEHEEVNDLINQFNEVIKLNEEKSLKINSKDEILLNSFFGAIIGFTDENFKDYSYLITDLNAAMTNSIKGFRLDDFASFNYNPLEMRVLILVGTILEKTNSINLSNDIIKFCLSYFAEIESGELETNKLVVKLYLTLSFNHHRMLLYRQANDFAIDGIEYAIDLGLIFCLPNLYIRKGVSEYLLGDDDYYNTLEDAIWMFRMIGEYENSDSYISILKELYGIDIIVE